MRKGKIDRVIRNPMLRRGSQHEDSFSHYTCTMRHEYRSDKFAGLYALFTVLWGAASLVFLSLLFYALNLQASCSQSCPDSVVARSIGFGVMFLLMSMFCLGNAASLHVTSDSKDIVKRYDKLWIGPRAKQAMVGLHVLCTSLAARLG